MARPSSGSRAHRPAAAPSSAAPQPPYRTTRLASLTRLNAVGALLAAKPSPYQLLSGDNISARFVVPTVAASVDLVIHLGIDNHGVRRVNGSVRTQDDGRINRC